MSNYWDLYCLDCDAGGGWHWNHGSEQLAAIWQQADLLAPLARFTATDLEIRIGMAESGGYMESVEWLATHLPHRVVVRSEYGYLSTDCNGYSPLVRTCLRRRGHEGEHAPDRDYDPCVIGDDVAVDSATRASSSVPAASQVDLQGMILTSLRKGITFLESGRYYDARRLFTTALCFAKGRDHLVHHEHAARALADLAIHTEKEGERVGHQVE